MAVQRICAVAAAVGFAMGQVGPSIPASWEGSADVQTVGTNFSQRLNRSQAAPPPAAAAAKTCG